MSTRDVNELTIRESQRWVSDYLKVKGEKWTRLSDHYLRVTHLVEEIGELARGVINLDATYGDPNRRGVKASREQKLGHVEDSLGDIFYHLLAISISYKLDLQTAFENSMKSIQTRYPALQPTSDEDLRRNQQTLGLKISAKRPL